MTLLPHGCRISMFYSLTFLANICIYFLFYDISLFSEVFIDNSKYANWIISISYHPMKELCLTFDLIASLNV